MMASRASRPEPAMMGSGAEDEQVVTVVERLCRPKAVAVGYVVALAGIAGVVVALWRAGANQDLWGVVGGVCALVGVGGALWAYDWALDNLVREAEARDAAQARQAAAATHTARACPRGPQQDNEGVSWEVDPCDDWTGVGWRVPYPNLRGTPVGACLSVSFAGGPPVGLPVVWHTHESYPVVGSR